MEMSTAFDELQEKLLSMWPALGAWTAEPKTMVVVPSLSLDVPPDITPLIPAYEERYLFLLLLLGQPQATVIYVTSQPVLPRIVNYYLRLNSSLGGGGVRSRMHLVSIGDPSATPLTAKLLARPRTLDRIRRLIPDPDRAHLVPFTTTVLEEELAVRLGIPMYAAPAKLLHFGTKSGSRQIFEDEGVRHPRGRSVRTSDEVVAAIKELSAVPGSSPRAVLKLDAGVGGLGNADLDISSGSEEALETIQLEGGSLDRDAFLAEIARQGGVIEERIGGGRVESPSVQMRIGPGGDLELLSTHDQLLGGPSGQSFHGALFPADPAYASAITAEAMKVGARLAREGVIGRFAVDFVVVERTPRIWDTYAIEINLRKGGTTHPFLTLQLLTQGRYDGTTARFETPKGPRYYEATDHLESPEYAHLTPDDLLDLAEAGEWHWDPVKQEGVVFHMMSALPVAGRLGLTAIGSTPEEAHGLREAVTAALDDMAGSSDGQEK